ncbi:Arf GTPase activating protein [Dillenia turbinata]|uniref:Arf GTPase activating protein n=1 Tax=Dillenia turbinata TaxID=194707 RepID=A0AAN8Z757_9MAGN
MKTSRVKEEERIERVIRGLLKQPENRRCINCNNLGPQYVCTTFWTFVCTTCSGIQYHDCLCIVKNISSREFTHRVKSVSMAKFSSEEADALQAGGNQRAREIYFKEFHQHMHSLPDNSNLHRLRDFIRHVYVDRRFTGERCTSSPSLSRLSLDDMDSFRSRSGSQKFVNTLQRSHSGILNSSGKFDERNLRYYLDEMRSPTYRRDNIRAAGYKRNPVQFEVVDDRIKDDSSGRGRRIEFQMSSSGDVRNRISPPKVHPAQEILGEKLPAQRLGEPLKASNKNDGDGLAEVEQKKVTSGSKGATPWTPGDQKALSSSSLIDFIPDPQPAEGTTTPQKQQTSPSNKGSSSELTTVKKMPPESPNPNTLEFLLFELGTPMTAPASNSSEVLNNSESDSPSTAPANDMSLMLIAPPLVQPAKTTLPTNDDALASASLPVTAPQDNATAAAPVAATQTIPVTSSESAVKETHFDMFRSMQQPEPSANSAVDNTLTAHWPAPPTQVLDNQRQQSTPSFAENAGLPNASALQLQPSQSISQPAQYSSFEVQSQPPTEVAKPSARKELPADLFTSSYPSFSMPVAGWQVGQLHTMRGPTHAMGCGLQYQPRPKPQQPFPNSSRASNPFDLNDDDNSRVQAPVLIESCPLVLPLHPSILGAFAGQHAALESMPPSGLYGTEKIGNSEAVFSSSSPNQLQSGLYTSPPTPNPLSTRSSNPFS